MALFVGGVTNLRLGLIMPVLSPNEALRVVINPCKNDEVLRPRESLSDLVTL